jgi:hypothetical protein
MLERLRRVRLWRTAWVGFLFAACTAFAADKELERTGGPYVPTPTIVVDQMLRMGNVGAQDFVIDLGSGDGVIVLTAAQQFKARGLGVDIDPALVKSSNAQAKKLGIDDRVSFAVQDVFKTDVSKASVITLYLLPAMMANLKGKIFLEAKPGTRVVSHDYVFGDWAPDDYVILEVPEKEKINGTPHATIYLWVVPAKIGGKWQVQMDGGEPLDLTLKQTFQSVDAKAAAGAKPVKVTFAGLRGKEINFTVLDGAVRRNFTGSVEGDAMQGTVETGGGRSAKWTAKKL